MENNLIEMLVKLMSNSNNSSEQNPAFSYYPNQAYQNQTQNNQNNLLPLFLSLLGNKASVADIFSSNKEENKKTEINSVSGDEILL